MSLIDVPHKTSETCKMVRTMLDWFYDYERGGGCMRELTGIRGSSRLFGHRAFCLYSRLLCRKGGKWQFVALEGFALDDLDTFSGLDLLFCLGRSMTAYEHDARPESIQRVESMLGMDSYQLPMLQTFWRDLPSKFAGPVRAAFSITSTSSPCDQRVLSSIGKFLVDEFSVVPVMVNPRVRYEFQLLSYVLFPHTASVFESSTVSRFSPSSWPIIPWPLISASVSKTQVSVCPPHAKYVCQFYSLESLGLSLLLSECAMLVEAGQANPGKIADVVIEHFNSGLFTPDLIPGDSLSQGALRRRSPKGVACTLVWRCVAQLEKAKLNEKAVECHLFLLMNRDLISRKRTAKVLHRLSILAIVRLKKPEVWDTAVCAATGVSSVESIDMPEPERVDLMKRLSNHELPVMGSTKFPAVKSIFFSVARPSGAQRYIGGTTQARMMMGTVEQCALVEHYLKLDADDVMRGLHCEGRPIWYLFQAMAWVSISACDYCMHSPLDDLPAELGIVGSPARCEFERVLDLIDALEPEALRGLLPQLMVSSVQELDVNVIDIGVAIGPQALVRIFRHILSDVFYWVGGLPDLIVWRVDTEGHAVPNSVLFSEVKGPGDSLSARQHFWIHHLSSFGVSAEVCYVTYLDP